LRIKADFATKGISGLPIATKLYNKSINTTAPHKMTLETQSTAQSDLELPATREAV
jgi:hypothetical protein